MHNLTIDGKIIKAKMGSTVLEAALENGIDVPRLCYHPELSVVGGCRLCLVEVDGYRSPVASCGLACSDGMSVKTRSPVLFEMRRSVLQLLLASHPLNCITCEQSGSCLLQRYAYEHRLDTTVGRIDARRDHYRADNPFFVRDMQYCILCGRCVRACDEVVGVHAIDYSNRGFHTHISTAMDVPLGESACVFCGSCVQVCPTAALRPVAREHQGREWQLERVKTICGYCGVGCEIEYARRDGEIVIAQGTPEGPVNGEFLCVKGRFGWDFVGHRDRLTRPLLRRDVAYKLGLTDQPWTLPERSPLSRKDVRIEDSHLPVDWDLALDYAGGTLAEIVRRDGPDAVMGLASARCTNEDNYLLQKFFRASIKTNNIDHCARL